MTHSNSVREKPADFRFGAFTSSLTGPQRANHANGRSRGADITESIRFGVSIRGALREGGWEFSRRTLLRKASPKRSAAGALESAPAASFAAKGYFSASFAGSGDFGGSLRLSSRISTVASLRACSR